MLRIVTIAAAFLALAGAASAAECRYASLDGSIAVLPDPLTIDLTTPAGHVNCQTFGGGTGISVRGASCDDGSEGAYFFAPATPTGEGDELLVFLNTVFYRHCD